MYLTSYFSTFRRLIALLVLVVLLGCSTPEEKAAEYISSGYQLLHEDNYIKASLQFRNALQINSNLVEAIYGLALIEEHNMQWRNVFSLLTRIQELDPTFSNARIKLAQLYLASGQIDLALEDAKDLLEKSPDNSHVHALMAAVKFRLDDDAGALEDINRSLVIDPLNTDALLVKTRIIIAQRKFGDAIELLNRQIRNDRDNPSLYLMKIQAYKESGDLDGVGEVLETLVRIFPDKMKYKESLARYHISRGNHEEAERFYQQIAEADDSEVTDKLKYINYLEEYESDTKAISVLRKFISANPEEYLLKFTEAQMLEAMNKTGEARAVYQGIIDVEADRPVALTARVKLASIELKAGNEEKVENLIQQVLIEDKYNEAALIIRAGLKYSQKDIDSSIVDLRTVIRDNPDSIRALSMLAKAHEGNNETQLAKDIYMRAYKLNPAEPNNINNFAFLLMKDNQLDMANELLENSLRKGNRSVLSVKLLAQVKLALRDWDGAEELVKVLQKTSGQESISNQIMGMVLQGRDQYAESVKAFKRAHQAAPSATQPIVALVRTYIRYGKNESAKIFLNSVLSVDEENVLAYILLGLIATLEGETDEVEIFFQKVVDIAENLEIGYRHLALLHIKNMRLDDAISILRQGIVTVKNKKGLSMMLASTYEKQRKFDAAIDVYSQLLKTNPDLIIAKNNLASLLIDYRTDTESKMLAVQLAQDFKNSKIPHFRDTYAWASLKGGGNTEEAILILESIVRESESNMTFNYHLAEAFLEKGDKARAAKYLENVIKYSNPDTELASKASQVLQQITQQN